MNETSDYYHGVDYQNQYQGSRRDESVNMNRYIGMFLSNWYWFVISLFLALTLAYGINKYSESIYAISSTLLIQDDKNGVEANNILNSIPGGNMFKSQQTLQNEIGILRSFELNKRVMKKLSNSQISYSYIGRRGIAENRLYYKNCPFYIKYDSLSEPRSGSSINLRILKDHKFTLDFNGSPAKNPEYSFGEKINEMGFNFSIFLKDVNAPIYQENLSNKYKVEFTSSEALANEYRSKLSITPIDKDATLVTLSTTGLVPDQEAEYLNCLMSEYIKWGLDYKSLTADSTIAFIDKQIKEISDSLKIAEEKLQAYRDENRIINLGAEATAVQTKLESLESEKTTARLQLQYYSYLNNYITTRNESGEIVSPSLMGVADQALLKLVNDLSMLQQQKKQAQFNFASDLPSGDLLDKRINDTRAAIKGNIESSIDVTENRLKDINDRISKAENEVLKLPGNERKMINFQRIFDLNNSVYTYMLEKRSEAGIAKASTISSNRIIDSARADLAYAISPRKNRNMMIAILMGFLAPGLIIFLIYRLNNKILDKTDIENGTEVPVIGFIGHSDYRNEMPVIFKPGSSLTESFRSIRTSLKYFLKGEKKVVISVTSAISGEGKTFIATNLAGIYAMLGKKTLVVGLDLRKPRIQKLFNISGDIGLSSYLIGESEYDEIIRETEIANLFFTPSGPVPPNPAELIESERMKEFISKAKEDFDYVILDTPPSGIVSDAILLGSMADLNLFVLRQRFSSRNTVEYIQDLFVKKEMNNMAIIVNDIYVSGYYGYGLRYGAGLYPGYGYNYGHGTYGSYHTNKDGNYYIES